MCSLLGGVSQADALPRPPILPSQTLSPDIRKKSWALRSVIKGEEHIFPHIKCVLRLGYMCCAFLKRYVHRVEHMCFLCCSAMTLQNMFSFLCCSAMTLQNICGFLCCSAMTLQNICSFLCCSAMTLQNIYSFLCCSAMTLQNICSFLCCSAMRHFKTFAASCAVVQ